MSYSTSNPPALVKQRIGGGVGGAEWRYVSTDTIATVMGDNYFSDGVALGMTIGDLVVVVNTTSGLTSLTQVEETTGAGVTVIALTAAST